MEIAAWSVMTGVSLSIWHVEILRRMDVAYLSASMPGSQDEKPIIEASIEDPAALTGLFATLRARVGTKTD